MSRTPRAGVSKRRPELPTAARGFLDGTSKAELLEVAWDLASLCNPTSADDERETVASLLGAINARRESRGARKLRLDRPPGLPTIGRGQPT